MSHDDRPRSPAARSAHPFTILVADDDTKQTDALRRFFSAQGWRVIVVNSGRELLVLLTLLEPGDVDVVLLDLHLGDVLGHKLIPLIKLRFPELDVITLSGLFMSSDDGVDARKLGARIHLLKPLDYGRILYDAEISAKLHRFELGNAERDARLSGQSGTRSIGTAPASDSLPLEIGVFGSGASWLNELSPVLGWSIRRTGGGPELLDSSELVSLMLFAPTAAEWDRALEQLPTLRKHEPELPVVVLIRVEPDTAELVAQLIAQAYAAGATLVMRDGPPAEPIARVVRRLARQSAAISRRTPERESFTPSPASVAQPPLVYGNLRLEQGLVYYKGRELKALTGTDRRTLRPLMQNGGKLVTHEMFEAAAGGEKILPRTLSKRIDHLRERIRHEEAMERLLGSTDQMEPIAVIESRAGEGWLLR